LLHADRDEASFPLRRQVVTDVLTLRNASLHVWYEQGGATIEALDGVHEGIMDLSAVELPDDALYYLIAATPGTWLGYCISARSSRSRCRAFSGRPLAIWCGPVKMCAAI
jgi:hypothetical protein